MPKKTKDLSGQKFGTLTWIERMKNSKPTKGSSYGQAMIRCKCDCGNVAIVQLGHLTSGHTKSCGCMYRHGMKHSREYRIWQSMKKRCFNKNDKDYKNYGERGITVHNKWAESHDFPNFYEYMGLCPPGHTLERIDNDGNYEPGNVRWATPKEQARNTRKNRILEFNGQKKCVAEWAEELGINNYVIFNRLNLGWPVEKVLTTPIQR